MRLARDDHGATFLALTTGGELRARFLGPSPGGWPPRARCRCGASRPGPRDRQGCAAQPGRDAGHLLPAGCRRTRAWTHYVFRQRLSPSIPAGRRWPGRLTGAPTPATRAAHRRA